MQNKVIIIKLSCGKSAAREKCRDSDEQPVKRLLKMAKSSIGSIGVEMQYEHRCTTHNEDSPKQSVSGAILLLHTRLRRESFGTRAPPEAYLGFASSHSSLRLPSDSASYIASPTWHPLPFLNYSRMCSPTSSPLHTSFFFFSFHSFHPPRAPWSSS